MTTAIPSVPPGGPAAPKTNRLGLVRKDYDGAASTLCNGCGHDAITSALIQALWEDAADPYRVAKLSGIGCSSKTTAYFLSKSWGFNTVHGRMPSIATGCLLANRTLLAVGVSGDGDTASIGVGQFVHAVRRNVPVCYVVENNGVYGLTKGQFSATSERGAKSKYGETNPSEAIDLCSLALELGATFVARSFSADKKQLVPVLKAAVSHRGIAIVDVISPCVTFNNHPESRKSYDWGRENEQAIHEIGYVNPWDPREVDVPADRTIEVEMPDGGRILVRKLGREHDPRDRHAAKRLLAEARTKGEFLTGLFYVDTSAPDLLSTMDLPERPLALLGEAELRPPRQALDEIMESFGAAHRDGGSGVRPGARTRFSAGTPAAAVASSRHKEGVVKRRSVPRLGVAAVLALAQPGWSDEQPATVTAAKEEATFTLDLAGTFDAVAPVEVLGRTQAFGEELEIEEALASPAPVEKGATLIRFKSDRFDEVLAAAERDLGISRAAVAVQVEDNARQAEAVAVNLARLEREAADAAKALETFEKVERPLRLEEIEHGLQGTRNWIQDQTEELAQLEKMYKADDLTEETEDVVLRRTRRDLERSRKSLEFQITRTTIQREIDLPRDHENMKLHARRTAGERDRFAATSALQLAQGRLEIERAKANLALQEKQVAKLRADREKTALAAPEAGLALPGALVRGKWQPVDERALRKGARMRPTDVVFTIVKPGSARVFASAPEAVVLHVAAGQDARVAPGAAPGDVLAAKVASVAPVSAGTDYVVSLDLAQPDARFLPGQTCKVRVTTGRRSAILLPAAAVEDGGFERAVHVLGADGKPQRRVVRTGSSQDGRVEVLSGVSEGDKVLTAAPKK